MLRRLMSSGGIDVQCQLTAGSLAWPAMQGMPSLQGPLSARKKHSKSAQISHRSPSMHSMGNARNKARAQELHLRWCA